MNLKERMDKTYETLPTKTMESLSLSPQNFTTSSVPDTKKQNGFEEFCDQAIDGFMSLFN